MCPTQQHRAARWRAALPWLAAVILLAGCGTSASPQRRPSNRSSPRPAATSSAPGSRKDASATAAVLLDRALQTMKQIRSYRFTADESVTTTRSIRTRIVGEVVTGQGVAYQLTVGGRRTQVVRLPDTTYLRTLPGHWSRMTRQHNPLDPSATLQAVLRALHPATVSIAGHGKSTLLGQLPPASATALGLPAQHSPVTVSVTVDTAGHVLSLTVDTATSNNGQQLTLFLHITYDAFDHIKPITRPA